MLPVTHDQTTEPGDLAKYPALIDATLMSLSEGLESKSFSSVDLVNVSQTNTITDGTVLKSHRLILRGYRKSEMISMLCLNSTLMP